jgi:hypothetical protein
MKFLGNGIITNKRRNYCFMNIFDGNGYPLQDVISINEYEDMFLEFATQELHGNIFPVSIFEQLLFSVLNCLNYSIKSNIVNQRMSLFCLENLMLLNKNDFDSCSNKLSSTLFSYLLFFTQNSEDFMNDLIYFNGTLKYKNTTIDILKYNDRYFEFVFLNKSKIESCEGVTNDNLYFLKEVYTDLLSYLFYESNPAIVKISLLDVDSVAKLYESDKEGFYNRLAHYLAYYYLGSWDDDARSISAYYARFNNLEIEKTFPPRNNKTTVRKKCIAERFIDIYVFFILHSSSQVIEIKTFLGKKNIFYHLLNVIQFHPMWKNHPHRIELEMAFDKIQG